MKNAKMNNSYFREDVTQGRVALVTGGGSGIGFEIAMQLGRHGARVAIMGRRQAFLDKAVALLGDAGVEALAVRGDVRMEEDARRAVEETTHRFGSLDTLVNSAAGNFLAASETLTPKGFKTVMDIDAVGVYTVASAAREALARSGRGVVINISATLHYGATWYQVHASAAKAAIDSVTRSLALEWGEFGIRVAGIAPGPIADTPGLTKLSGGAEGLDELIGKTVPVGRMGTKGEIAMAALFLLCNEYVSGDTIVVDGGAWLWAPPPVPREMIREMARGVERKSRGMGPGNSKL
eukprot:g891.t1